MAGKKSQHASPLNKAKHSLNKRINGSSLAWPAMVALQFPDMVGHIHITSMLELVPCR